MPGVIYLEYVYYLEVDSAQSVRTRGGGQLEVLRGGQRAAPGVVDIDHHAKTHGGIVKNADLGETTNARKLDIDPCNFGSVGGYEIGHGEDTLFEDYRQASTMTHFCTVRRLPAWQFQRKRDILP
ncbi:hypothetical protein N7532_009677 [Penicillium argentinense]|uniref:Uncharacterized protein n=1 Tax=Penicillium argentinense TaxID=1131581 RepID=A0A9W9EZU9_9EURO|nr:uncharacterized protein N7532_009677 [Penicillium argentinense]KAJ5090993.1 hypothetical protein N7532_009677 [Penicillium argentinense]